MDGWMDGWILGSFLCSSVLLFGRRLSVTKRGRGGGMEGGKAWLGAENCLLMAEREGEFVLHPLMARTVQSPLTSTHTPPPPPNDQREESDILTF